MSEHKAGSGTQITVAIIGLIGVLAGALLTNWEKLVPRSQDQSQVTESRESQPPHQPPAQTTSLPIDNPDSAETPVNISGLWRDTYGSLFEIHQQGESFTFTARNPLNGLASQGSGTIRGRQVKSRFQTNMPSTGTGTGTLSADGRQMTGTCDDSVLGSYVLVLSR